MYAIQFYSLLNEAYKLEAKEQELISIAAGVPHMENKDRNNYFRRLETAKRGIIGIGNENNDYSGLEKLKKEFKK